ncbi:MAG: class I SAM-dependent methyltransferase [Nanoarchaeota archaeon]|nr:class I SAM-dependent methyltransferase [Nanoarchaeota archaeon]MBU1136472.1 class I SAM-dependent methyltransferase [Nanoarchaeota archaeon]
MKNTKFNRKDILNKIEKKIEILRNEKLSKKKQTEIFIELFTFDKILMKISDIKNLKEKRDKLLNKWYEIKKERINKKLGVVQGYKIWSKEYDKLQSKNPMILVEEPIVEKILPNLEEKQILDVGCGTGRWSIKLKRKSGKDSEIFAIEPNQAMLNVAKKNIKKKKLEINFKKAGIYNIPFKNEKFDFIICALVLSHIKNLNKAIKEMARVLKNNGIIIITTRHPGIVDFGKRRHNREGGVLLEKGIYRYFIEAYPHEFREFIKVFKKNNLEIVDLFEEVSSKSINKKKVKRAFNDFYDTIKDEKICLIFKLRKRKLR